MATILVSVAVAAIASMVIGMLWYGPLFGKKWMTLMKMKQTAKKTMPASSMLVQLASSLVMAYVLAMFITMLNVTGYMNGALVGFWVWLGFIATVEIGGVLWEGKPTELYILKAAGSLVTLAVMGAIIASGMF